MKKLFFAFFILFYFFFLLRCYSQQVYGWSEQISGFNGDLWSVSSVDSNIAWVSGDSLKVLKTTNGGVTWISVPVVTQYERIVFPIYNIYAIDADNAICTGSSNTYTKVYKTTNGGNSWSEVFYQLGGFIDNIYMFDTLHGILTGDPVGSRFSMWKTSNGGANWDSTGLYIASYAGEAGVINNLFVDGSKIWMGISGSNKMYYSTNYGTTWIVYFPPSITNVLWSNNPASSMFILGAQNLYMSTNSGMNWSQISGVPGSGWFSGLTGTGNEWWSTRSGLSVYYSSNNGSSWNTQYTVSSKTFNSLSKIKNGKFIWGIRKGGGISKYGLISGINAISQNIPEYYKLYQNYPNPFNPTTEIRFDLKEKANVMLEIYDINGKEISTLVNRELNAGSYSVDFDASSFSSGVFFYVFRTNNYIETKKMILIK